MVAQNWIVQLDAQLRYYMHIDPDGLTDEEWALQVEALRLIRKKEAGK
jgi:hypothetical protein